LNYLRSSCLGVMLKRGRSFPEEGMRRIGHFELFGQYRRHRFMVAGNLFVLAAWSAYVVSVGVWLLVLSAWRWSFAYPS